VSRNLADMPPPYILLLYTSDHLNQCWKPREASNFHFHENNSETLSRWLPRMFSSQYCNTTHGGGWKQYHTETMNQRSALVRLASIFCSSSSLSNVHTWSLNTVQCTDMQIWTFNKFWLPSMEAFTDSSRQAAIVLIKSGLYKKEHWSEVSLRKELLEF
jgi:hypothetical protein